MAELCAARGVLASVVRSELLAVFIAIHLAFRAGAGSLLGRGLPIIRAHLNGTAQSRHERRAAKAEFGSMMEEELTQNSLPFGRQREKDLATIVASTMATHIPASGKPVYEFDRAVMLDLQALR